MSDFTELLGSIPKDKFKQTVNRLLNECFILKNHKDTASDYRFIIANKNTFNDVLDLLGYELVTVEAQGVITINNPSGTGRMHFSKLESIILLILRLIYIEKMKELSQVQDVIITLEDIYEKYGMLKLGKLRKDLLVNSLRSFKRVNLIQNLDRMDRSDTEIRIQIYPSILFAVTAGSLDEVYHIAQQRLNEFAGEEDAETNDENTDEDSVD